MNTPDKMIKEALARVPDLTEAIARDHDGPDLAVNARYLGNAMVQAVLFADAIGDPVLSFLVDWIDRESGALVAAIDDPQRPRISHATVAGAVAGKAFDLVEELSMKRKTTERREAQPSRQSHADTVAEVLALLEAVTAEDFETVVIALIRKSPDGRAAIVHAVAEHTARRVEAKIHQEAGE